MIALLEQVLAQASQLPDAKQDAVAARLLQTLAQFKQEKQQPSPKPRPQFGSAEGVGNMTPDFDEPLEELQMSSRLGLVLAEVAKLQEREQQEREQDAIAALIEVRLRKGYVTQDSRAQTAHRFIRMVLLVDWDPIGIFGEALAEDEYDAYVPQVRQRLQDSASPDEIAEYLNWLETEMMGLSPQRFESRRKTASQKLHAFWTDYFAECNNS